MPMMMTEMYDSALDALQLLPAGPDALEEEEAERGDGADPEDAKGPVDVVQVGLLVLEHAHAVEEGRFYLQSELAQHAVLPHAQDAAEVKEKFLIHLF